ncbi:hypothetical protein IFT63_16115 [Stenotrophomonas sp. CFBP 13724]|uniref:hypothetical protein n=1 Tax=Stenotrophomonas sp. CFBP 13724 TaxID=2775298 RepID=UPI001780671E|nr:hypothetical protein [Stenotrophomonas sp. CFBP 13724]MBD8645110.1 hypothetical protein [Stenotrophomonas sp. CFBP 13724]
MRGSASSAQCNNSFFFFVGALLLVLVALLLFLLLLLLLVALTLLTLLVLLALLALLALLVLLTLLVLLVLLILLIGHLDVSLKPHAECRGHGHPLQALVNHVCACVEDGVTTLLARLQNTSKPLWHKHLKSS